jgi:hypothetical protein
MAPRWLAQVLHSPQWFQKPTTTIFKGSVKIVTQIILVGMSTIFHCTILSLSRYNGLWVVAIKNDNLTYQPPAMFIFFVFRKNGLMKSCSSSEDLSEYEILWPYVEWWKSCIHLRCLNVRHFGMIAATELKIMSPRSSSMAWPLYWIS